MARCVESQWQDRLRQMRDWSDSCWDHAEALSWMAGYDFKDRYGKWQRPNPSRQQGLVELAMELYNKGLADGSYQQPSEPLRRR